MPGSRAQKQLYWKANRGISAFLNSWSAKGETHRSPVSPQVVFLGWVSRPKEILGSLNSGVGLSPITSSGKEFPCALGKLWSWLPIYRTRGKRPALTPRDEGKISSLKTATQECQHAFKWHTVVWVPVTTETSMTVDEQVFSEMKNTSQHNEKWKAWQI